MENLIFRNFAARCYAFGALIWLCNQTSASSQPFWKPTTSPAGGAVYALASNTRGHVFAGTIDGGVFRSTNEGDTWEQINNGLTTPSILSLAIFADDQIWAGTNGGGAFRSTDNGNTWAAASNGLTDPVVFSFTSNGEQTFAATFGSGVFRSSDNGLSWQPMSDGLWSLFVFSLACDANGTIFAGTIDGIFASTNNASSWLNLDVWEDTRTLALSAEGVIFAGSNYGKVFRSQDGGQNWMGIRIAPANTGVRALLVNPRGHVFAGTFGVGGVFRSIDNGDNWEPLNEGLTDTQIFSFTINPTGHIFAGALSGSIFRSMESTTSVQESSDNLPTSLLLHQNYPNPFNAGTEIRYELPPGKSAYQVSLKIYDLHGRLVKELVNASQAPGAYSVAWDGTNFDGRPVASKVYFYSLQAGELKQVKKLVLLK